VFDREGGLWFTDMGKSRSREIDRGGVYYIPPGDNAAREVVFPMMQPNGIGLSADERTLYVAETITSRLWAFDLARPGTIAPAKGPSPHGGRLIATLPDYRLPDSLALDAAGNVCIATIMTGGITIVAPSTGHQTHIDLPDAFTTNICFGGPGLRTAYVTLGSTGSLVALDKEWPGLPLNFLNPH
jgi:gluconolactonase